MQQTNNRVTPEQVEAAMARCQFVVVHRPNGTTSTFVHAFLDGTFYLATGHSACVDPDNYSAELGEKYARERCDYNLRNKLWELLGFQLYDNLRVSAQVGPEQAAPTFHGPGGAYPLHRSSKLVRAFQIGGMHNRVPGSATVALLPTDSTLPAYHAPREWMQRHQPAEGGYVVFYPDGYVSYSPFGPFEATTVRIDA